MVYRLITLVLTGLLLAGCERQVDSDAISATATAVDSIANDQDLAASTAATWQQQTLAGQQSLESLRQFASACAQLRAQANPETLESARQAWRQAHQQLLLLSPLFSLGDTNPGLFLPLVTSRYLLDAWPIEPGYLDSFDIYLHSGLVNDIAIELTADNIRQQHGLTTDSDVILGMHAAAYLLWGEDGQRSYSEFADVPLTEIQRRNGLKQVDLPSNRRATLLILQTTLLEDDLSQLLYRLEQQASALSATYLSLAPGVQQELWRSALLKLLQQVVLQVPVQGEEWHQHNLYAGHSNLSLAAQLQSIEALLYSQNGNVQPLAHWLVTENQAQQFRTALQRAEQMLREFAGDWQTPAESFTTELQGLLQQLIAGLSIKSSGH